MIPKHIQEQRDYVHLRSGGVDNVSAMRSADTFDSMGVANDFSLEKWKAGCSSEVLSRSSDQRDLVCKVKGIDAALANAFRRVMLSELPTMAIEDVWIYTNTSVLADEILAHRIGLVPIDADGKVFKYSKAGDEPSEDTTIVFMLDVACTADAEGNVQNRHVYAKDLRYQAQAIAGKAEADKQRSYEVVYPDILLCKLKPGQRIQLQAICRKGTAKEHAKWSPVSTASYRLQPVIKVSPDMPKSLHEKVVQSCPMKVFDIEDSMLVPTRENNCTMCRECFRDPAVEPYISLLRDRTNFHFSIEATGNQLASDIFVDAVKHVSRKAQAYLDVLARNKEST